MYFVYLESDMESTISHNRPVIDIKKGNSSRYSQGSWIHPDLAVQLAQWISPQFALQVSRWIRELLIEGSVSLQQKLQSAEEELKREREERQKIERKVLRMEDFVETRRRLEKTQIIYIGTTNAYQQQNRFKVGGCSSKSLLKKRFSAYNTGRANDDSFFCVKFWLVHSYGMIEKIVKTLLEEYRDNRQAEMYHIHGSSLVQAIEFIVDNSNESAEWFNEHFRDFNDRIMNTEPVHFTPIPLGETLYITNGTKQVELADITGWSEEKVEAEIEWILDTYKTERRIEKLDDDIISWGDLTGIIKRKYRIHKIGDWRDAFRQVIPKRSERLKIKGLKLV